MSHQDVPLRPGSQCAITCDGTSCPIKTTFIHTKKCRKAEKKVAACLDISITLEEMRCSPGPSLKETLMTS